MCKWEMFSKFSFVNHASLTIKLMTNQIWMSCTVPIYAWYSCIVEITITKPTAAILSIGFKYGVAYTENLQHRTCSMSGKSINIMKSSGHGIASWDWYFPHIIPTSFYSTQRGKWNSMYWLNVCAIHTSAKETTDETANTGVAWYAPRQ